MRIQIPSDGVAPNTAQLAQDEILHGWIAPDRRLGGRNEHPL